MGLNAFEGLLVHAPVPLLVVGGSALRIEYANRAANELVPSENVPGESLLAVLPELEEQGCAEWLRDGLRRSGLHVREALRRVVGGRVTYWTVLCRRIEERGAQEHGVVAFVDTTTQVLAQRELEQRSAHAEAANRAKDEFVAMLSHELRHPVAPVVRALELMRLQGIRTREQAVIERQVGHLIRLIDDLLDMARITRGTFAIERRLLDLDSVVAAAVEVVQPALEDRRQHVRVDVPKDLRVHVDADRMRQVVSNLLINAAKYSDRCSEIVVSAVRHERKVLLSVVDQGIGMTAAKLARLFDPSGAKIGAGSWSSLGLGLVIVRMLVRQHGGEVHAYSEGPGMGSRFVVELPCAESEEAGRRPAPIRNAGADGFACR